MSVNICPGFGRTPYFLLLLSLFSVSAFGQGTLEQQVTLEASNITRSAALFRLSEIVQLDIGFAGNLPGLDETINLSVVSTPLSEVLDRLLTGTKLTYEMREKRLVILRRPLQFFTLSGYLEDKSSGERLVAAAVWVNGTRRGVTTNGYGFFSLQLPEEPTVVSFSSLGYPEKRQTFSLRENKVVVIGLSADLNLPEVVVRSSLKNNAIGGLGLGVFEVGPATLNRFRGLAGEASLFDYVYQQSNSQRGADGLGGFFVRGGGADQNLVLLDDVPIFQPAHSFGLFSVINPAIIRNATFFQEGFLAKYGGRLASILDVRSREGNSKRRAVSVEIGTLATKFSVELPAADRKGSLLLAARRTHIDPLLKSISRSRKADERSEGLLNYSFYDVNLKWHRELSAKNKVYLSLYRGRDTYFNTNYFEETFVEPSGDVVDYAEERSQDLSWGNTVGSLRWNHLMNDRTFANTTLTYSRYSYRSDNLLFFSEFAMEDSLQSTSYGGFSSGINDWRLKTDFDHYTQQHHYQFGAEILVRQFTPGAIFDEFSEERVLAGERIDEAVEALEFPSYGAQQFTVYGSDRWQFGESVSLTAGLRASLFSHGGATFFNLDPRLRINLKTSPKTSHQFSLERMHQPLHLITSSGASLPTNLWVPASGRLGPQESWQASVTNHFLASQHWAITLSGYYRSMSNLIRFAESVNLPGLEETPADFWEDQVISGEGKSLGVSASLGWQKQDNHFKFGYFYQRSTRSFTDLNDSSSFPFAFDRPHKITLRAERKLGKRLTATIHWEYASGRPITLLELAGNFEPLDNFPVQETRQLSTVNGYRLRAYHRLDFSVRRNWRNGNTQHQFQLGLYNAYNQSNQYYSYLSQDLFEPEAVEQVSLRSLPLLPSFSYQITL